MGWDYLGTVSEEYPAMYDKCKKNHRKQRFCSVIEALVSLKIEYIALISNSDFFN